MALNVVDSTVAGVAPNMGTPGTNETFQNNGRRLLHVKNTSGSPITVTIDDPRSTQPASALAWNPDVQVSVPATTGEKFIGPFDPNRFNDDNSNVAVVFSATAGVTAEVIDA